jgi:hypothetical protein
MAAAAVVAAQWLTKEEFFSLLLTDPHFSHLANQQLKGATKLAVGAGGGVFVGMLLGGPVGAALGGAAGFVAAKRYGQVKSGQASLLQLVMGLSSTQRDELWGQVQGKFGSHLTRAVILQQSPVVTAIIERFLQHTGVGGSSGIGGLIGGLFHHGGAGGGGAPSK